MRVVQRLREPSETAPHHRVTQTVLAALCTALLVACSSASQGATPSPTGALVVADSLSEATTSPDECPLTPYYVNPEPIPANGWRDGFPADVAWFRSADKQLWAQDALWHEGGGVKVPWLKPLGARLEITGRRLDGDGTLTARVPDGYHGDFQATGLFFSAGGCWEVEGQAEDSYLRFIVYVRP